MSIHVTCSSIVLTIHGCRLTAVRIEIDVIPHAQASSYPETCMARSFIRGNRKEATRNSDALQRNSAANAL